MTIVLSFFLKKDQIDQFFCVVFVVIIWVMFFENTTVFILF